MCSPQDCVWAAYKVDRPYAILLCRHSRLTLAVLQFTDPAII